jgi:hypothetical protein
MLSRIFNMQRAMYLGRHLRHGAFLRAKDRAAADTDDEAADHPHPGILSENRLQSLSSL